MKTIKKIIYYFTATLLFPIILICRLLVLAVYGLFYMLDSLFEWVDI